MARVGALAVAAERRTALLSGVPRLVAKPHSLRLASFQDAEPAVTFEGSELDVVVALDTLFS